MRFFLLSSAIAMSLVVTCYGEAPIRSTLLYNGRDLTGWVYVSPGKETLSDICRPQDGGVLFVAGKPNGYTATVLSWENYALHFEWRWMDKPGNSGALLHITDGPIDRIWPISFQVQTKNGRTGDLLPMSSAQFAERPSTGAIPAQLARGAADSEKPVGEWNSCEVVCRGSSIEIAINGVLQNRATKCVPASGKIGFQLEGVPYELRNIRVGPLKPSIGASGQTPPNGR